MTQPFCPECGSERIWKAGLRYTTFGEVQRYICRDCGFRFSDPAFSRKMLSSERGTPHRQICVLDKKAKNLVKVEQKNETVKTVTKNLNEIIINYMLYLRRLGKTDVTIEKYTNQLKNLAHKVNLEMPEEVALTIRDSWTNNNTRNLAVYAYDNYIKYMGLSWTKPKYRTEHKLPFIPTDEELQLVINSGVQKTIIFSNFVYETGCRVNEAFRVDWTDINFETKKVYIKASKHGNARFVKLSDKMLNLLNKLRRDSEKVFKKTNKRCALRCRLKTLSRKHNNKRFLKIHFHTFRHCKALREYHKTKDVLHVKRVLGHKSLLTTQIYVEIYTQLYDNMKPDRYMSKVAETKEEKLQLISEGWDFVSKEEETWYFRKPK